MDTVLDGSNVRKRNLTGWRKNLLSERTLRGVVSVIVFLVLWEIGSESKHWFGFGIPWVSAVPAPSDVVREWAGLLGDRGYWESWYLSFGRVFAGFAIAMLIGIPFG